MNQPVDNQHDPDRLLAAIQRAESRQRRGRLKVFLGMCPGVGKTYAMLDAARREARAGRDVMIGYVETHGRRETDALLRGLPVMPRRAVEYRGVVLTELDLDGLLDRRPQLAVVDELAHTNPPDSRHPKRWQDVEELLDAGLNVFTTLNVQHVDSRSEAVRQIIGVEVRETVPDSVLDDAVLELVDLPPHELVQRLREGKVYLPDRADAAERNFFREGNLTALRELALRLVADHVGADTTHFRRADAGLQTWRTGNRLLVAVGPSPLSEPLIRWTRRMADELRCPWLAVHVEGSHPLPEFASSRLTRNLDTARELGAEVVATAGDDIARGLLRVARDRNVTQIVLGKPAATGLLGWWRSAKLIRRLMEESGDIDLHVIRASREQSAGTTERRPPLRGSLGSLQHYFLAVCVVGGTGLLNLGLHEFTGPRVPGMVFLVVVVLLALVVGRGPVLLAGAASAFAWNFFFLPPRFTLAIERADDAILLGTYVVVSLVLGQLVARIRTQAAAERQRESRSTALYELTRELAEATTREEVVWRLIGQTNSVFQAPAAICLPTLSGDRLQPHPDSTLALTEKELSVANWAFRQRKAAGKYTTCLPGAGALHLPLFTQRRSFGVLSIQFAFPNLLLAQRDLVEAFARQGALVLDRIELRRTAERTLLIAESDRLSRALLNSISHELRTPLAASTSAASALAEAEVTSEELRRTLVGEILEANSRLDRIVGNLLDVARLESGKVTPRLDWHDARDLIQTTLRELHRELSGRMIRLDLPSAPMLVRLDFSLVQHALANLLVNAVLHTPPGTPIDVQARLDDAELVISVADRGPGIPESLIPRVFEKFVRAPGAPTGGSGLGLTIAKGFVEAQDGRIAVENRPGGGACFSLRLPRGEPVPRVEVAP